ncbi:MAG: Fic family protein [Planctomycetota bacterium]
MRRSTGTHHTTTSAGESVRAFVPKRLPPRNPPLVLEGALAQQHTDALASLGRLAVAGAMVPSADWFLYGFVRKEAVISSQIEGTQATFEDVVTYEATRQSAQPADAIEVCNYVEALTYARQERARRKGLPLCVRLLCEVHKRLMKGARGAEKQPGAVRRSQNWIGGTRPGNARFVPPPPQVVPDELAALEKWLHAKDPLPPLVRAGLAHVQFETIHPFLDGNGRIGRLLITLLCEHWGLLSGPLLYVSLAFKRHRQEYYEHLNRVRTEADWEGWTAFFLDCVKESADDGVTVAARLQACINDDRTRLAEHQAATVSAIRLFDRLPNHPVVTLASVMKLVAISKPTAGKTIDALQKAGILRETTGKRRDRVYAYRAYLDALSGDTELPER